MEANLHSSFHLIKPNYVLVTVWQDNIYRYHSFHEVHFFITQIRGLTCLMAITGTDATSKYYQIILIITYKKGTALLKLEIISK